MQMYRVKFARKINAGAIDLGDVVVCAGSQDLALIAVATVFALPVSDTEFDVARVKPSLFQISRRTVEKSMATFEAAPVSQALASNATFPGVTESRVERHWFRVMASADISAVSENEAIAMLSRAIAREIGGEKQKRSLRDLDIVCERQGEGPRTAAVEQNALYTVRRIFQGGDTRT